jgi:hypothetical protein
VDDGKEHPQVQKQFTVLDQWFGSL